jgi:hypothetical protein
MLATALSIHLLKTGEGLLHACISTSGADLGFFVPQSKHFGRRGVIGTGRGLDWAWSATGGEGGSGR